MATAQPLDTSRALFRSISAASAWLSLPALAVVWSCLLSLLTLTVEQWSWLLGLTCAYVAVVAPGAALLHRWLAAPIAEWLDEEAHDERGAQRAFACLMALPHRLAAIGMLLWIAPLVLVAAGLALRFGIPLRDAALLVFSGIAAGFTTSVLTSVVMKERLAGLRARLVLEVPDPAERRRLVRSLGLRAKLGFTMVGATLIPVVLAAAFAIQRTEDSVQGLATDWQVRILASLPPQDASQALDALQQRLDGSLLPLPIELGTLDSVGALVGESQRERIGEARAAGARSGGVRGTGDDVTFAWRVVDGDRVVVAATRGRDIAAALPDVGPAFLVLMLCSAAFSVLVASIMARDVSGATEKLSAEAARLASGDLRAGESFESEDEMGELSRSFDAMRCEIRETLERVAAASERMDGAVNTLAPLSGSLSQVTADQVEGIARAAARMEEIGAQVRGITDSTHQLSSMVEDSGSSIVELGTTGEELNATAVLLGGKVEEVAGSIEQMVHSVRQVSENTGNLGLAAEETSTSMDEIAASLREVDGAADDAARLSKLVVESAESGHDKVRRTIEGMEAIRGATETAERVIRGLHARSDEIGAIVDVIDDVADETNLLALNAAIIAAQAGEHGRAFSVVADEIKELAERVLSSTKEIGALIASLQTEAGNAIGAVERGSASVASGVELSAQAGMALEEITRASRDSGGRIHSIVAAVREQAKGAGHVVALMDHVREGVEEIQAATVAQNRGNDVVHEGIRTMRDISRKVRGSTGEQARGAKRIRDAMQGVRDAVDHIDSALQEQLLACGSALEFLEAVRHRTGANEESTRAMEDATAALRAQAQELRDEVRRFQI
jgi:methyl-accepting chemotaxis protein